MIPVLLWEYLGWEGGAWKLGWRYPQCGWGDVSPSSECLFWVLHIYINETQHICMQNKDYRACISLRANLLKTIITPETDHGIHLGNHKLSSHVFKCRFVEQGQMMMNKFRQRSQAVSLDLSTETWGLLPTLPTTLT